MLKEKFDLTGKIALASGLDIPFVESDGDTRGVMLTFPDGFVRDEYADAFEVEYHR